MRLIFYYCMNCQILYLDIHGAQRIHPGDFKDQPSFPLVPTTGEGFRLSSKISTGFNWLLPDLTDFPSCMSSLKCEPQA